MVMLSSQVSNLPRLHTTMRLHILKKGVKFHLILSIYILGDGDETPKILNSSISPPVFVDSRKSARDNFMIFVNFIQIGEENIKFCGSFSTRST